MSQPIEEVSPTKPLKTMPKDWNTRRKIVALGAVPMMFMATVVLAIPLVLFYPDPLGMPITIAIGMSVFAQLLALGWGVKFGGLRPIKDLLWLRLPKWWKLLAGAIVGFLGFWVLQFGAMGLQNLSNETIESSDTSLQLGALAGTLGGAIFVVLAAGGFAPGAEDFFFRGLIVGSLQASSWNKAWLSVLISGVVFGMMHFQGFSSLTDIFLLVWIAIMGGIFAMLMLWSKSIWTAVAAHMSYNMVTAIMLIMGNG